MYKYKVYKMCVLEYLKIVLACIKNGGSEYKYKYRFFI